MIVLDTHVILWWQEGGERLSKVASREIARAEKVYLSPISFWEIATLLRKARIELDRDPYQWTLDLLEEDPVLLAPISAQVGVRAGLLESGQFPGDAADRILCATAAELNLPLVTKDQTIRTFARSTKGFKAIW